MKNRFSWTARALLPINREDIGIGPIMRLYEPDLKRFASWEAPSAEKLD